MTELIITHDETGRVSRFPSEAAYEAALDWYNDTSKPDLIDWYVAQDAQNIGEIWADADCTALAPDWADVIMAAYARAHDR